MSDRELPPRSGTYRLGVFGSMMNPPHLGHLAVVDAVHEALGLDRVMVVPAGLPPHRSQPAVAARTRLDLSIRAFADIDHAVVSDTEIERGEHAEPGYMVDTIQEFCDLPEQLGYDELVVEPTLVVGGDQAATLASWHRWDRIVELARIAVVARPDAEDSAAVVQSVEQLRHAGARIGVVLMDAVPISSTLVRAVARSADRARLAQLVPAAILDDVLQIYAEAP